jgi:hypothetical protein
LRAPTFAQKESPSPLLIDFVSFEFV